MHSRYCRSFVALTFEAMPIIRFQTKLTASIDYKHTCECGRTFATIQLEK